MSIQAVNERTVCPNTKPESRICRPGEPRGELQKRGSKLSSLVATNLSLKVAAAVLPLGRLQEHRVARPSPL